ncbi:MAG: tetratricopeptide repeat protein [Desulfocapsaceae bacterium]|nr:tetratricopeptide repeat protein [Desulfocapsaceae bacterium]
MEALRKAEQAKKQAAGAPVTAAGKSPVRQKEPVSPELHLSLERQDPLKVTSLGRSPAIAVDSSAAVVNDQSGERQISQASPNEDGKIELAEAGGGGQQNVLAADAEVADMMVVDTCAPSDLNGTPEPEAVIAIEPELSIEIPVTDGATSSFEDVGKSGPDIEQEPDVPDIPAIHPTITSVESSRETARTVFAAKKEYQRRSRNRRLLIVGSVGGAALFAMAGFFYFTYRSTMTSASSVVTVGKNISQQDSVGLAVSEVRPDSIPAAGEVALSPAGVGTGEIESEIAGKDAGLLSENLLSVPAGTPTSQSAPDLSSPHDVTLVPGPASSSVSASVATLVSPTLQVNQGVPALSRAESETQLLSDSAGEPESSFAEPIVITHRAAQPQVNPLLAAAYGAYQKGDFEQARQEYQKVLQAAPQHRGALLGLADIAMHWSEKSLARDLYLRVLDQDPGDPLARAGLLAIAPMGDLVQQESELKLLLEQHPNIAQLFFSLGNVYAAGQRWSEAQQAYFNALQTATNIVAGDRFSSVPGASDAGPSVACVYPDYPFNLAVSLEHLGQLKPAVKYYREALQLAGDGTAGFDVDALRTRLKILEQGERP